MGILHELPFREQHNQLTKDGVDETAISSLRQRVHCNRFSKPSSVSSDMAYAAFAAGGPSEG
jgi:hypothetical protein